MRLIDALRSLMAEQDCYLCGGISTEPVCPACVARFPVGPAGACPRCALPSSLGEECGACLARPPHFDATIAAFAYGEPLAHTLQAFKYRHALGLAHLLSARLDCRLGAPERSALLTGAGAGPVDVIVPMPLAPLRLAGRGFNQALEIARPIAARRNITLATRTVRRVRNTPPQAQLPWKERARNVRGVFECVSASGVIGTGGAASAEPGALELPFKGLRVAVIDDVMTTGATLNELARILKQAGAVHVSNWVLARTLPRSFAHATAFASA